MGLIIPGMLNASVAGEAAVNAVPKAPGELPDRRICAYMSCVPCCRNASVQISSKIAGTAGTCHLMRSTEGVGSTTPFADIEGLSGRVGHTFPYTSLSIREELIDLKIGTSGPGIRRLPKLKTRSKVSKRLIISKERLPPSRCARRFWTMKRTPKYKREYCGIQP